MTLTAGTRLGAYEVAGSIGAGGMGEVYRARDTKLNRDVAIKVLPSAFADDPERLARFTREAQTLASLNHPNIATIYGIEEIASSAGIVAMTQKGSSGDRIASTPGTAARSTVATVALVMELVEGEDLSTHIARGPIPIAEALPIARQIAEALEAAHEHGIVHRDLKPANIKVRGDGMVKVLDFGLAKAMDPAGTSSSNPNVSHSPTLTHQGTSAGMIIGTAAYMSPEQAKGKAVDKRTDIWAFGVVLYEMLTGKRAFKGDDVSETLASVLKDTLSMDALPADTPPRLKRLIERCLDRDLKMRLRDIGEARIEIARIESGAADIGSSLTAKAPVTPGRRALPWAAGAVAGAILAGTLTLPKGTHEAQTPSRLSVEVGADVSLEVDGGGEGNAAFGPAAILSPDDRTLAFVGRPAPGKPALIYVRSLEQLAAAPLAGTENARNLFFSPDARWIGFFADGKLKKIPVGGGAATTLCEAPNSRGGAWSEDGTIYLNGRGAPGGLWSVSSSGGTPSEFSAPDADEGGSSDRWPQVLQGGRVVLFTSGIAGDFEGASIAVQRAPKGPRKIVLRGGYHARYVRSGHLVYIHEGTLFAVPFDLDALEVRGPAAPVIEGVLTTPNNAGAQFAVSDQGTAVFLPGQAEGASIPIQWMGKDGRTTPLRDRDGKYRNIRFSPDGGRLAMDLRESGEPDIWVYDWARDLMSRLTLDPGSDSNPVWTEDGQRIVFSSTRGKGGKANLYWQRTDGTGEPQRLTESVNMQTPTSWHPKERILAFEEQSMQTGWHIMTLRIEGDETSGFKPGNPTVFLNSPDSETGARFSPDGRWLAYSGGGHVYVRAFPGPGPGWQVSTISGSAPVWSRGGELLFRGPGYSLMGAPWVVQRGEFRAEKPRLWSSGLVPQPGPRVGTFDLHRDGDRVAVLKPRERGDERRDRVVIIQNFSEELRRAAPLPKR